jgi:nucleotide-binding universal stress UspA family protein
MKDATLLVVVGPSARPADLTAASELAAARNLHLSVLLLSPMPQVPVYSYGIGAYGAYGLPDGWQEEVDRTNAEMHDLRDKLSEFLSAQGAGCDVRIVSGEAAALPDAVARRALTCDMVLFADDLRASAHLFDGALRGALFHAPGPVLLNATGAAKALEPSAVMVAWKAGIPSARAVRAALPLLRAAEEVTVALIDPVATRMRDGENPGTDVAAWLTHCGCRVTVQQHASGGEEVGKVILRLAGEHGADLVVMGAYDHSRLVETVFGGTTRTMTRQTEVPVLLCH